jgi:hypothetical protein
MNTSFWIGRNSGLFDVELPFSREEVNRHSVVLANICEVMQPQGQPLDFPFQGDATMQIHNIVPLDDGRVLMRIQIDFDRRLNYRLGVVIL